MYSSMTIGMGVSLTTPHYSMYILISSIKIPEDRIPVFVVGGSIVLTYDIEGVDFRCSRDLQDRAGYLGGLAIMYVYS